MSDQHEVDDQVSFEVSAQDGTLGADEVGDGATEQLDPGDTLIDRGLEDPLDEGYSPPDYPPGTHVPTPAEEAEGLSLDEHLAAELPDVDELAGREDSAEVEAAELGTTRAGRLVDPDGGGPIDTEKAMRASDVGFAGGAASAEEAAVHVFDPDGAEG